MPNAEEHNLAKPVISKMVYNGPDMQSLSDVALFIFQDRFILI